MYNKWAKYTHKGITLLCDASHLKKKTEEMEAGYDTVIELEPQEEKRFLEKKKEIINIAVKAHARLLPAIARCHNPVTANRVTQETRDPQVRIREGLKPDRLKMDFTPVEFRKWKAQITTFFEASNLQHATVIWSEWRLTVIAATVRIALVDILDLSEVDIPAGVFLHPAVGWG